MMYHMGMQRVITSSMKMYFFFCFLIFLHLTTATFYCRSIIFKCSFKQFKCDLFISNVHLKCHLFSWAFMYKTCLTVKTQGRIFFTALQEVDPSKDISVHLLTLKPIAYINSANMKQHERVESTDWFLGFISSY